MLFNQLIYSLFLSLLYSQHANVAPFPAYKPHITYITQIMLFASTIFIH